MADVIAENTENFSEEDKKHVQESVEAFLQNSLSETDLNNLDVEAFANNFIKRLNDGLKTAQNSGKNGVDLNNILKGALADTSPESEDKISIQRAKDLGYSAKALEHYSKVLQKVNPLLKNNEELTKDCALAQMDLANDLKEFSSS